MSGKREKAAEQKGWLWNGRVVSFKRYFSHDKIFSPAKMASFAGVEVFLGFKHPLELKDLSAGERRSHLLSPRLPIWTKLEKNIFV